MKKVLSYVLTFALFAGSSFIFLNEASARPRYRVVIKNTTARAMTVKVKYKLNRTFRNKRIVIRARGQRFIYADKYTFVKIYNRRNRLLKTVRVNVNPKYVYLRSAR